MAEFKTASFRMEGNSIMSAPTQPYVRPDAVAENLSGISINQNGAASSTVPLTSNYIWQTFRFPSDYPRGVSGGENVSIPRLSGFHVCAVIAKGLGAVAGLDWIIDYWHPTKGWVGVAKGTEVGAPSEGENVWFDVLFTPVDITEFWYSKFRLGLRGRNGDSTKVRIPITYDVDDNTVVINEEEIGVIPKISPAPLIDGKVYTFVNNDKPAMIEIIGGDAYYSEQQGLTAIQFTAPNPYSGSSTTEYVTVSSTAVIGSGEDFTAIQEANPHAVPVSETEGLTTVARVVGSDIKAYQNDGVNPLLWEGKEASLRFRILSTAADSDRDCTGSLYRTVAITQEPESVRSSVGRLETSYWMSAPNPSKFAVEALYLDASDEGEAQVLDHILVDPITPGIYMNVYYSNDVSGGVDTDSWDGLLWTRIPKTYLLRRKETFAFPEPITAKFIKLEFTHLQPMWYNAGTFQLPTKYRKHPKWVMDYHLSLYEHVRAQEIEAAPTVNVTYDALDLAYNYYLDDMRTEAPNFPTAITSAEGVSLLSNVLAKEQQTEETLIDPTTLQRIRTSLRPYVAQPSQQNQNTFQSLLQRIVSQTLTPGNYPTEATGTALTGSVSGEVSSLERDSLIVERQFPVTSFHLTCRHYYMTSEAYFEEERAYFAGIKEVSLSREHYASRFDHDLYVDNAGDNANILLNDLSSVDHAWVTYSTID